MDKIMRLRKNLQDLVGANPNHPIDAIVKSVEDDTCTVEIEGLSLSDVRLKTTADGKDNFLIIPKVESKVLMLSSDGSVDNLTVIKIDVAEKIIFKENGLEIIIDSTDGKVQIKNNSTSLKELFQKSASIKKNMKVSTPMGPSGTPLPDIILMIEQFENEFKQLLK